MATRVTQQLLFLGYTAAPEVRVTSVKMEVLRSAALAASGGSKQPVIFIISS